MKYSLSIFMIVFLLSSCKGPQGDKAEVTNAQDKAQASELAAELSVNLNKSMVTWVGSKPAGKHNGTIKLASGKMHLENGQVTAGEFVMDMATVTATDVAMDAEKNGKLTGHLKSADFFDVEKYPTASFELISVEDIGQHASEAALKLAGATHFVTGNLTMKESVKAVKFPAIITVTDNGVTAKALFTINRTDWGMHYKSDKSFGDQIIHPEVEIGFDITTL
jgi:polyisoprenoid-binding protein YceI